MNGPIDIIVPWVNPDDPAWRNTFREWTAKETGITSECRYRDFGIFNYFFRGIEQNCPWARKVFLVLASPSQIPSWLDTSNPRLRIVFHEEYIPKNMLPTFNSNVIEMFFHMIPDLSDNFVLVNDDMFFVNPSSDTDYFVNDLPVDHRVKDKVTRYDGNNYFCSTQRNNRAIFADMTGLTDTLYFNHHLPIAHRKPFWNEVWQKYALGLLSGLDHSHFRNGRNYSHWLFRHLQMGIGRYVEKDITLYESYIVLRDNMDMRSTLKSLINKKAMCVNDQEALINDTDGVGVALKMFLDTKFPRKCSFEK